jgi:hypothetical protein
METLVKYPYPAGINPLERVPKKDVCNISAAVALSIMSVLSGCGGIAINDSHDQPDIGNGGNMADSGADANCDHVEFSLGPNPPNSTYMRGSVDVPLGCWNITNGCMPHTLTDVDVTDTGLNVGSVDFGNRFYMTYGAHEIILNHTGGNPVTFFDLSYDLPADTTGTLCISADIALDAMVNDEHTFIINSPSDITIEPAVEIGGDFPLAGPSVHISAYNGQ